ncbi:putative reverse transcriptase domain-containing protein, partial [Tanacetum coccineum]
MRQRHWLELLSDYDCDIRYHLGKANVVAESRKERVKPLRVRALVMTIGLNLPKRILEAQTEALKPENLTAEDAGDLDGRYYITIWKAHSKALGTRLDLSITYHPETDSQSERTIQTLEDMLRACVLDFGKNWDRHLPLVEFSYNTTDNHKPSQKAAPFEAQYCEKSVDHTIQVHNTFYVSNLKKCLSDESLVIPLEELRVDDKLHFVEEPVEVMDRKIKQLKRSRIPIIKVRWNSKRGLEFTWEHEDKFKQKYPHLFTKTASLAMSSDNTSSAVTYMSISSDSNGTSWGIPLVNADELSEMDPYEEVAQQGHAPPLSPAYVPDLIELDDRVPVYVLEPEHPEYHVPTDDDIQ